MKHLVIDARYALPSVDGIHTYLRNIVPRIVAAGARTDDFRTTMLVHPEMADFWRKVAPESALIRSSVRPMRPAQNWQIPQLVGPLRPDLFFYPAWDPPVLLTAPLVFTIHDVTAFNVRPFFERLDTAKRAYVDLHIRTGLRRARATLVVSEATRRDIGRYFGGAHLDKVHATPLGISVDNASLRTAGPRDCLLYVGCDRPHKNLRRLILAYAKARRQCPDLPRLEMAGSSRNPEDLRSAIKEAGVGDHVVLHGHVPDQTLEDLYARAAILVFPSLGEGFGLPILEAMVRGVPVITSNTSACGEVAGNAALTVNPHQTSEIADAMVQLFGDHARRAELVTLGRARAAEFTWDRTAQKTLDVIQRCFVGPAARAR